MDFANRLRKDPLLTTYKLHIIKQIGIPGYHDSEITKAN